LYSILQVAYIDIAYPIKKIGHKNELGLKSLKFSTLAGKLEIASLIKAYSMVPDPKASIAQSNHLSLTRRPFSSSKASLTPLIIMSTDIITGAITGPHHGSGIRKSRSQSNND